jgi:adenosylcobyric acid synthase
MKAKTIQVCGTGSDVGKSVIVAGLCRIFLQNGYKVAPFKAQNMALNSAVTPDNLEIGRAQAMQAAACKIEPSVDMNPILLKPISDVGSQVIVRGKPLKNMSALEYKEYKLKALKIVKESLNRLVSQYDIVVIEGAGSPAEINLKSHDIVNMKIASLIKSPVILVGDIDRGGVFAWLVGTLQLLKESERCLVKGFIINKFRGDKRLLDNGLSFLEKKTGKKVLGVIPYFKNIKLPEEDSLFFEKKSSSPSRRGGVNIVVIKLPHISNFTDFACFEQEKEVSMEYTTESDKIKKADCIILPGTKNTFFDLKFLCDKGLADVIRKKAMEGTNIIGICGGYQMLGKRIVDTQGVESKKAVCNGLSLLNVETNFKREKNTFQVEGIDLRTGLTINGYEIHHGLTKRLADSKPIFLIKKRGKKKVHIEDGTQNHNGKIWGTYIHGILDNSDFRRWVINKIREEKGLKPLDDKEKMFSQDREYDKLAELLRSNLNTKLLYRILNGKV